MTPLPAPRRRIGNGRAYARTNPPQEQVDAAEACYQCVVLVRGDREAGWRLFTSRESGLPWSECLAILRAEILTPKGTPK